MTEIGILQEQLIEVLWKNGTLRSAQVEKAFRAVPRHFFLPNVPLEQIYRDEAIITKRAKNLPISSSSQPAIMAIMLEQLALQPGQRVLEIGAGTGYNAALMAYVVGETGHIVTIDIDEDIVQAAREHLQAAGVENVQVVCGDGGLGYSDDAPYDRIILTVGAWDITPAWFDQLKDHGRIVLPLSLRGPQKSIAFERVGDHLASVSIEDCGFMRLRGEFAGPETIIHLGKEPGLVLMSPESTTRDAEALYHQLTGASQESTTGVQISEREIWSGLSFWLALHDWRFCALSAMGEVSKSGLVPCLFGFAGDRSCHTHGLISENGLCVLMRDPSVLAGEDVQFELFVKSYGNDESLAPDLINHVRAWDTARRPSSNNLRIHAYPKTIPSVPTENQMVIEKYWTRLWIELK